MTKLQTVVSRGLLPCLAVVALAGAHRDASAQGVDCAAAEGAVAQAVCADGGLKSLDAKMVSLYGEAIKGARPVLQQEIAAQQQRWIPRRDACATEPDVKACLADAYGRRNELLGSYVMAAGAAADMPATRYVCEDKSELTLQPLPGQVQAKVSHGTSNWTLPHVPSASGAKYAAEGVSVWNKGREVRFEQGSTTLNCTEVR
jgi:uncharacterized protein